VALSRVDPPDEFDEVERDWRQSRQSEQRRISGLSQEPSDPKLAMLWRYARALKDVEGLAKGGVGWRDLAGTEDTYLGHFHFRIVRAAKGAWGQELLDSAKRHLQQTDDAQWLLIRPWIQRDLDRANSGGLSQIVPAPAQSSLGQWSDLRRQAGLELQHDVELALEVVKRSDHEWLVQRLEGVKNLVVLSTVSEFHVHSEPEIQRTLARSKVTHVAALGVHEVLERLMGVADSIQKDLRDFDLNDGGFDWREFDKRCQHRRRLINAQVRGLIAKFDQGTRTHLLIELLVWSAGSLPPEGDFLRDQGRKAIDEMRKCVRIQAARALATLFTASNLERLIGSLLEQGAAMTLEDIATASHGFVALKLRRKFLREIEQRLVPGEDEGHGPRDIARERSYLENAARSLSTLALHDALDLATWFSERIVSFPVRTARRGENVERWRQSAPRAALLLVLGAWTLRQASLDQKRGLQAALEKALRERIRDWETQLRLGVCQANLSPLLSTAVLEVSRVLPHDARRRVVSGTKTAWSMLVLVDQRKLGTRRQKELRGRLQTDFHLLDRPYSDHLMRRLYNAGLWHDLLFMLERWGQLDPADNTIYVGRVDFHEVVAVLGRLRLTSDPANQRWRLEHFVRNAGSVWRYGIPSLEGFLIAAAELDKMGQLDHKSQIALDNARALLKRMC
jgi:hypothetical protein